MGEGFSANALHNSQIDERHHLCLSQGRKEGSMIRPMIHRQLTRGDLACLVDEIARMDVSEGREADEALQAGAVGTVLPSPAAPAAVLGRGGAPPPPPPTLLLDVPPRAPLPTPGTSDTLLPGYS